MKTQVVDINRVIPYARNPRNNGEAVAKVASSIREFGFRQPIVVDNEMTVVAGHTRLLAAKQLDMGEVPVHIADGLTEAQIRAYRLADNRVSQEASWDDELLSLELTELDDDSYDLTLTGFNDDELAALLAEEIEPLTDEDAVPEVPEEPTAVLGDIYQLGNHRLICGDAAQFDVLEKLMDGQQADMIFTDPPYNVNYGWQTNEKFKQRTIKNDHMTDEQFEEFLLGAFANWITAIKPGAATYVCCSDKAMPQFRKAFSESGFKWSCNIIWSKNTFTLSRADYHPQHEPIIYGWPETGKHFWCGRRDAGTIWNFNKPRSNDLHPTMKPVELIERALENSSKTGDIILDTFGGSGSTMIACEKTGRAARLSELDPKYVDVIVRRWEEYTGKKAVHLNG